MKIQDYLPVVEVVRQAGGVITDWAGQPLGLASDGTVLAAAKNDPVRARSYNYYAILIDNY